MSEFYSLKTLCVPSVAQVRVGCAMSRLNGSRDPGRQLARYQAPSTLLTAPNSVGGTQRAVDPGSVLIGRRATRYPPLAARKPASTVWSEIVAP